METKLTEQEIQTLKEIADGKRLGTNYQDSHVIGLLREGYVTEYLKPVLTITEEGRQVLKRLADAD